MENQTQQNIEQQVPVQPAPEPVQVPIGPKKSLPKWPLIIIAVILLTTLLTGAYLLGKNQNVNQKPTAKTQTVAKVTPTPTPDPTTSWRAYTVEEIGLTYKVPSDFPELIQQNSNGQTGKQIYISAGKTKVIEGSILLGTTSVDYTAGRGGMFVDLQGYFKQDSKYLAKFVSGKTFEIPTELASEITNKNGLKILIVKGKKFSAEGLPASGTPGEGHIGALINTNSKTYPGFAIDMTLTDKNTSELFNQILSTFKFTSPSSQTDETANIINDISKELGTGYIKVSVRSTYGIFAVGSAGFPSGGGIEFYAMKENGTWKLIWRGNEVPGCSKFVNYPDLPKELTCDPNY